MTENFDGGAVVTGPDIEFLRLRTVRAALSLEIRTGMKRSNRGRSTLELANLELGHAKGSKGYIRNKVKAYEAFDALLVSEHGMPSRPLPPGSET